MRKGIQDQLDLESDMRLRTVFLARVSHRTSNTRRYIFKSRLKESELFSKTYDDDELQGVKGGLEKRNYKLGLQAQREGSYSYIQEMLQ